MVTDGVDQQRFVRAIEQLDVHDHLCLIYESHDEQFDAIIPFIRIGLERGDRCIYVADDNTCEDVLEAAREGGIDADAARKSGALSVITKHDAYLKNGTFDPDWMIEFLRRAAESALQDGFRCLRLTGEMTWVFGGDPGTERLLEYEAKLNYFFPENEALAICQYNRHRFDAATLIEVIKTHPLVAYGANIRKNFAYIPPEEFLWPKRKRDEAEIERLLVSMTYRERAEQALADREQRFASLVKKTGAGYFRIDAEGRFEEVNSAWLKMHGYSSTDEVIGRHFAVTRANGDLTTAREDLDRLMSGEPIPTGEISRRRKDGSVGYHVFSASPVMREGKIVGLEGFLVDTTEHTLAEQANRLNAAVLETVAEGIYMIGLDDCVIKWTNRKFEDMFGYDPGEMVGMHVDNVNAPTDKTPAETRVSIVDVLRETGHWHGEVENIRKDGTRFWCYATASVADHPQFGRVAISAHIDVTERKKAAAALRESERQLKLAQEHGCIGSWMFDVLTGQIEWSDETYVLYNRDRALGPPSVEEEAGYYTEGQAQELREHSATAIKEGRDVDYDLAAKIPGRGDVFFAATMRPIRDADGRVVKLLGTVQDITERKEAEDALRESAARLKQAQRTAHIGNWEWDLKTNELYWSDENYRIFDIPRDVPPSYDRFMEHVHPDDRQAVNDAVQHALEGEAGYDIDIRIVRGDGIERVVNAKAEVAFDEQGAPLTMIGTVQDVTEWARAEEALRESEASYRELVQNANSAVIRWKCDGTITFFNEYAQRFFGYDADEVVGQSVGILVPEAESDGVSQTTLVRDIVTRPEQYESNINENIRRDGSRVWMAWTNKPVFDENGNVSEILAVGSDITDLKRAEEALRVGETFFREIYDNMKSGSAVFTVMNDGSKGSDYVVKTINGAGLEMEGKALEEVVGKRFVDIRPTIDSYGLIPVMKKVWETGQPAILPTTIYIDERYANYYENYVFKLPSGEVVTLYDDVTERKQAEQAIEAEKRRAQSYLDIAGVMIVAIDRDQKVFLANNKACEALECEQSDIIGRNWFDTFLPKETRSQTKDVFADLLAGKAEVWEYAENPVVTKAGAKRLIGWHNTVLRDEDGTAAGTLSSGEDITERVAMERNLMWLASFPELNPTPVLEMNASGGIEYSNPAADKCFPDLRDQGLAHPALQRIAPVVKRIKHGGHPILADEVRVNGNAYHRAVTQGPGKCVRIYMTDITERIASQEALADSEERYRRLVENSPNGVAIESKGKLVYANIAATRMLGWHGEGQLVGKAFLDLVEPEDRDAVAELIDGTVELGETPSIEAKLRSTRNRVIDVETVLIPTSFAGKHATQIVFSDITERKQLEQAKSDFVATVSHELRSPLAVILGFATFLEQHAGDASRKDDFERAARAIHERGNFMKSMVESLLEISHIQSGEFSLSLDSVDLGSLLAATARSVPLTPKHKLELKISSRLGRATCDPQRLSMALSNLVSNAVKFSPDGGVVRMAANRKAGHAIISVSDEGIGISSSDQRQIFDRFTQADMSSTRRFSGSGMGLYITRQVVEAHGGALSVHSKLGHGSTFTIDIPTEQREVAA